MSEIVSKIFNAQVIFEDHGKTYLIDTKKSLWTDTKDSILKKYRSVLKAKIKRSYGENAVTTFGLLAAGHQNSSGIEFVFLTPMIEHYFNYLVFYKDAYKQAIMDLYLFKREFINKIELADKAIISTAWVAKQNGSYLYKDTCDSEFYEKMDKELEKFTEKYLSKNPELDQTCIKEFLRPVKQFYFIPNMTNFQNIILQADKLGTQYLNTDWKKLLGMVESFNHNLGGSLLHSAEKVLTAGNSKK